MPEPGHPRRLQPGGYHPLRGRGPPGAVENIRIHPEPLYKGIVSDSLRRWTGVC
jgi:hypothetical protein